MAVVKRGQILAFGALVLTLTTIVTLTMIGHPWVAVVVTTTGLVPVVVIFVTGQYQPTVHNVREFLPRQPVRLPTQDAPDAPPTPHAAIE